MVAFPLLIIPIAIYYMIAFLTPPDKGWATEALPPLPLPSGESWTATFGDALIALALILLMFEVVKATRPGTKTVIDHLLSVVVLAGAVTEFAMVGKAATSTFAILCVICLVDVLAGITISVRVRRRLRALAAYVPAGVVVAPAPARRHDPEPPHPAPPARPAPEMEPAHHEPAEVLPPEPPRTVS